jgi:hypothetical protein
VAQCIISGVTRLVAAGVITAIISAPYRINSRAIIGALIIATLPVRHIQTVLPLNNVPFDSIISFEGCFSVMINVPFRKYIIFKGKMHLIKNFHETKKIQGY